MNLAQRYAKQQQVPDLMIAGMGGLSLWSDPKLRANNSWQQLDNFDLVVDGSIRKVNAPLLLAGPFTNVLYQELDYLAQINNAGGILRNLAIDNLGNLWDINGSTTVPYTTGFVATFSGGVLDIPFMGQMSGYYVPFTVKTWKASTAFSQYDAVYRYSATDGNLYCYYASTAGTSGTTEPKWPATQGSTKTDNTITWTNAGILNSTRFRLNYGIIVSKGYPALKFTEWKYTPSNGAESAKVFTSRIGVSAPLAPFNVTSELTTPNLNGYGPSTGRTYCWTYYNPNTLKDSSPSPFVGPTKITNLDASGAQKQLNGSVLPPLAASVKGFTTYQSVYLEVPISALTPTYGDGYTCIRCWATTDGGSSFFLLTQLYDGAGNLISNGDGSIPVATLSALQVTNSWTGFTPLPTPQNAVATARIFDGGSQTVNLAPDPENLGTASWTETTGSAMSVVPNTSPTGQATFQYTGTGGAASNNIYKSTQIAVNSGSTYAFQGYIDNTYGVGGTVKWDIWNPATSAVITSFTQSDNTAGNVTGTFTAPASGKVQIRAFINTTTVTSGAVTIWGDPYLELGNSVTTGITYPTPDTSLVLPAPAAESQQPPPATCQTGALFENTLFLVDYANPTTLWYSNSGDFDSYGINAYLQFPTDRTIALMELVPAYDRLLVSSGRTIDQVISNSPSAGFARFPLDPQHGSLSYRGSIPYGSRVFCLMDPGIADVRLTTHPVNETGGSHLQLGFTPESIISRPIKPYLDLIDPATTHLFSDVPGEPIPVIDNKQDLYLLGYRPADASTYMDTAIAMPLRGAGIGQFSRLTPLPGNGQVTNFREIQMASSRSYGVVALTGDKKVYQMFGGTQDGTLTATAVTQPLPTPADLPNPYLWDTEKLFRELIVEGQDLPNFSFTATDSNNNNYGPFTLASGQNLIDLGGIQSRQITITITHSAVTSNVPQISCLKLNYDIVGKQP